MPTTSQRGARLTYDDFVRIPDDGMRHEIIDGVHHVTPSPVLRHQQLLGRLHVAIFTFLEDHPEIGGVREYWLVDPKGRDLTIYRRTADGGFPRVAQLSAADEATVVTPLLPGFALSLVRLFA